MMVATPSLPARSVTACMLQQLEGMSTRLTLKEKEVAGDIQTCIPSSLLFTRRHIYNSHAQEALNNRECER